MVRTCLIIDDSAVTREEVQRALRNTGLFESFVAVSSASAGLLALKQGSVDLVLCDLMMPELDGFKFLSLMRARKANAQIPVILLTARQRVREKVRGLNAGAADYLTKPFHETELVARVRVHVRLKETRDRLTEAMIRERDSARQLRRQNAQLEQLVRTDALTGLANRRQFLTQLSEEFAHCERDAKPLGLVMIDLDHFKAINDTHGHQTGDDVLRDSAKALQSVCAADLVGRYGGEEFAILIRGTNLPGSMAAAEHYRAAIQRVQVRGSRGPISVSASFGVTSMPDSPAGSVAEFIRQADSALYEAKRSGRDCVVATKVASQQRRQLEQSGT